MPYMAFDPFSITTCTCKSRFLVGFALQCIDVTRALIHNSGLASVILLTATSCQMSCLLQGQDHPAEQNNRDHQLLARQ